LPLKRSTHAEQKGNIMAGNFSLDLAKFIEHAQGNMDKAVRMTVALIAQEIDQRTPRDTGRLVANWQFGKYSPPSGIVNGVELAVGAVGKRIAAEAADVKAGGEVWIVNNLPYAGRIEYGYSQKSPAGMVRVTLANLPASIDHYLRSLT
jgi:hypothetical protein